MKNRSVFQMLAIAFAVCLASLGMSAPAAAQTVCSGNVSLDGGVYIFQSNEWNSTLPQCATIDGIGFTLTTANFDQSALGSYSPATYPSVYRGCHWGNCTSSNPFPIEMSNLASATSSVTITQPSGYENDSAYDIWFNQTSTTSGQPNGTEIMIWINHQGGAGPAGSLAGTATIDGASYQVYTGRMTSWNIASYVANPGVDSVTNLNLIPFFNDAISRGMLQSSWWLIDVEYGFEVWNGGQGLSATNFSVSAAAGGSTGNQCTTVPSAPSGLTGTVASSSAINLAWTADTAPANCTISSYSVYRSTSSGFTPSSSNQIATGVTATSYADSGLAASTTYYYAIEAVDAAGTSSPSSEAAETTAGSGACTPTAIVPYISVSGTWAQETSATVTSTTTVVDLGPQPVSGGTWAWTGPNGFTSTARQINNIVLSAGANVYTATYTNASGCKSTQVFTITAPGGGSLTLTPASTGVNVAQGASVTDAITATGATGSVTYTAKATGTGVTATIAGGVLTVTASATAPTGASTVTVTGTSGTLTASTVITVNVMTTGGGSLTLTPASASVTVAQGASVTDAITPSGGNETVITYTATATGAGVTANVAGGVLTVTASATATVGTSTVTVTGTSGTLTATTVISVTVTKTGGSGGCTIDYTISPQNSTSFGGAITIVNNGSTALSSWTLTWSFANGQTVSSLWNGNEIQSGANVTVTNESYNGSIAAGGSYTGVGFNGTWNGVTNAIPTSFSLNGTACTVN